MNELALMSTYDPAGDGSDVDARGAEAQALLARILADRPMRRPRTYSRRAGGRAIAALASAAVVGSVVFAVAALSPISRGPSGTTQVNARLVVFDTAGSDIVAKITDPNAAASQLTAVFQANGLNIHVNAVPVSPSLAGTIVYSDAHSIGSIQTGACLGGGGDACDVGLVIPASFSGEAYVTVGRAAASGETYASSADVFGPGEALHCSRLLGQPASGASSLLSSKGLTASWTNGGPAGYVVGGVALSPTAVQLDTSSVLPQTSDFRKFVAAANAGC